MIADAPLPARHRWIHVHASGRDAVVSTCAPGRRAAVGAWLARGLPLVSRSRSPHDEASVLAAGMCLSPANGKGRIALGIPRDAVARIEEAPALAAVAQGLPEKLCGLAHALAREAEPLGFVALAFGSAAWQWRSGEPYVTPDSDLDVLARPPTLDAARQWCARLATLSRGSPVRIDGEVESPSGDAVNWREWADGAQALLVKNLHGPRLAPRASWEAAWS